jgi:hypothetical protein
MSSGNNPWSWFALGGVVLGGFWWVSQGTEPSPVPNAEASPPGVLGVIAEPRSGTLTNEKGEESTRRFTFQLRNTLATPVDIVEVATSCGCSVAEPLSQSRIPPGRALDLPIRAQLPRLGRQVVTISVNLRRGTETAVLPLELRLEGAAPSVARVLDWPKFLDLWQDVPVATRRRFEIRTFEGPEGPPWLREVRPLASDVTAKIVEQEVLHRNSSFTQRRYVAEVEVPVLASAETVRATDLRLFSMDDQEPLRETILVRWERRDPLRISPGEVLWSSTETEREVLIQSRSEDDDPLLERLEATTDETGFSVAWLPGEDAGSRKLVITGTRSPSQPFPIRLRDPTTGGEWTLTIAAMP